LEGRARARNERAAPRRSPAEAHPDQVAAATRISDELGAALGVDVTVRARGNGYRVELRFDDPDEALALARRLRPRAVA
ncbi:MAG: ParB/RepB/Spo0J family partition protein, partial [Solirubrobacteraceae bacterium]